MTTIQSENFKISENIRGHETKPLFLFEGGIHAREWLSITTNIYFIDKVYN